MYAFHYLKKWQRKKEFDRLGLRFPEDTPIAGERVPQMNIPVAPGRNIATMIEVAWSPVPYIAGAMFQRTESPMWG